MKDRTLRTVYLGLGLALVAVAGACSDSTTGPDSEGDPPALPPLTSMTVDLGLFAGEGSTPALAPVADGQAGPHFVNAALRVFAAQVATVVALAVPVATFSAAASNTPTFEDDGLWHWRFTAAHSGETYTAHLSGSIVGSEVDWSMRVSSTAHDPPLDEFLWYGGRGQVDRTSGTWTFYDPASPTTQVLTIAWTHTSETDHGFVATALSGPGAGDVLTADVDGDGRTLTFLDASEGTTVEVWWDAATGEGYLIAPNYNDGLKACWDASQEDVACS